MVRGWERERMRPSVRQVAATSSLSTPGTASPIPTPPPDRTDTAAYTICSHIPCLPDTLTQYQRVQNDLDGGPGFLAVV
jgi:hypothetical protein